ncbi:MAG: hypothetical protein V7754_09235 [Halioglobus sp.]
MNQVIMQYKSSMQIITIAVAISLIAVLAWLTMSEEDPCANPQADISASVLAEDGDQDALVNRAIIMKANCEDQ